MLGIVATAALVAALATAAPGGSAAPRDQVAPVGQPAPGRLVAPRGPGAPPRRVVETIPSAPVPLAPASRPASGERPARRLAHGSPVQPPRRYFQQKVSYRIEALLDDSAAVLHGRARMRYQNRAPERLDELYFYLYLNAFKPNSAWARRELEMRVRRFQDLPPQDQAFERLTSVRIDGQRATPEYPLAPDSTVVVFALREPLPPGESLIVDMEWDARPSTLPRRQGRRGRHYDFAEWFPIVAVRDTGGWEVRPLLPQGEFYGEFMDFDVTMDLAGDQVVAAAGVPVEGDPGWGRVAAAGFADSVLLKRDAYGPPAPEEHIGLLTAAPAPGRRRIRWLARQIHNFPWTTSPDYIYEGGQFRTIPIHVLYQPGDTAWAGGRAVDRTRVALAWLDSIFGPYVWPQVSNVHRIEGGGTEFPMMVMNGGASQGLILHEVGHQYTMGILANNEWMEGFLDEGFTSFQTDWYFHARGQNDVWRNAFLESAQWDSAGKSQPLQTAAADFRDFETYAVMTYTKPEAVYRMLQAYIGEATFTRGLHIYYEQNKLRHVSLPDFRRAMEQASGNNLRWFFDEWFRRADRLDYSFGKARVTAAPDGGFRTRLEVLRTGNAWMPITLQIGDTRQLLDSHSRKQTVDVHTEQRPTEAILDPDWVVLDYRRGNNVKVLK